MNFEGTGVRMDSCVVGCIVVNYFKESLTEKCIASLAASSDQISIDCIVVDNGSSGKIRVEHFIRDGFQVELLTPGRNVGFADGCNLAAKILLERGITYLLLLNNDAEVCIDTIGKLVAGIKTNSELGAVTGRIEFGDGRPGHWYAGATFSRVTGRPRHCNSTDGNFPPIGKDGSVREVPFISGCCLLARADLVQAHGLFRGGLFAYGEDLDWCLRISSMGYRLGYVRGAVVVHHPSSSFRSSSGKTLALAHYLSVRNLLLVNRLHFHGGRLAIMLLINVTYAFAHAAAFLLVGKGIKGVATVRAAISGLISPLPPVGESLHHDFGIPEVVRTRP